MGNAPPLAGPTPRQLAVARYVREYRAAHGMAPTLDEIAAGSLDGATRVTAFEHVRHLIDKGWLLRTPGKARSLRLTPAAERALGTPPALALLRRCRDVLEMLPPPLSDCYTNGLQADLCEVLGDRDEVRR